MVQMIGSIHSVSLRRDLRSMDLEAQSLRGLELQKLAQSWSVTHTRQFQPMFQNATKTMGRGIKQDESRDEGVESVCSDWGAQGPHHQVA